MDGRPHGPKVTVLEGEDRLPPFNYDYKVQDIEQNNIWFVVVSYILASTHQGHPLY